MKTDYSREILKTLETHDGQIEKIQNGFITALERLEARLKGQVDLIVNIFEQSIQACLQALQGNSSAALKLNFQHVLEYSTSFNDDSEGYKVRFDQIRFMRSCVFRVLTIKRLAQSWQKQAEHLPSVLTGMFLDIDAKQCEKSQDAVRVKDPNGLYRTIPKSVFKDVTQVLKSDFATILQEEYERGGTTSAFLELSSAMYAGEAPGKDLVNQLLPRERFELLQQLHDEGRDQEQIDTYLNVVGRCSLQHLLPLLASKTHNARFFESVHKRLSSIRTITEKAKEGISVSLSGAYMKAFEDADEDEVMLLLNFVRLTFDQALQSEFFTTYTKHALDKGYPSAYVFCKKQLFALSEDLKAVHA